MPAADKDLGLADGELEAILRPIAGTAAIALAVSGGADSLALLVSVSRWRRRRRRLQVVVLTVDHRLRPESRREAEEVAAIARAKGLVAKILTAPEAPPTRDIEAAARAARYRLLIGAALEAGASHLLLAHHRDDQAETFLMRLQRGSGVFGLAAMRPEIETNGIVLFRPFLGIARSRLAATAAAAGLTPAVDPMNSDPRFLRARIRRLMPTLAGEGLGAEVLAATAERLAQVADAIDHAAGDAIARAATIDEHATVTVEPTLFFGEAEEVRMRVLVRFLLALGGESYPPRFERMNALHAAMQARGAGRFKRTLAGTVVEWRGGRFQFYRELGRAGLPPAPVRPRSAIAWDHRFAIEFGAGTPTGLMLGALGEAGRRTVGAGAIGYSPGAIASAPALWRGTSLVAAPTLSYFATSEPNFAVSARQIVGDRLSRPPRFPDFLAD